MLSDGPEDACRTGFRKIAELSDGFSETTKKSHILHCFIVYLRIVNKKNSNVELKKQRTMKTKIIYVGTLLDLASMFEPEWDEEQDEEVQINILNIIKA